MSSSLAKSKPFLKDSSSFMGNNLLEFKLDIYLSNVDSISNFGLYPLVVYVSIASTKLIKFI